jgi:hypothetical protein
MARDGRIKLTGLSDPDWLDPYFGLTAQECRELAQSENRPIRVVGPSHFVTCDWIEDRLNVLVDEQGQVRDIHNG